MREIKFRAWDEENEMMLYQDYLFTKEMNLYEQKGAIGDFWKMALWHEWVLLEFTGLKDKNGKEIWEGDIVTCEAFGDAQVVFGTAIIEDNEAYGDNQIAGFYLQHGGPDKYKTHMDDIEEVIGNIYENPELLGGKPCDPSSLAQSP